MPIEPGGAQCLNGSPEQLPGKVSGLVLEKERREGDADHRTGHRPQSWARMVGSPQMTTPGEAVLCGQDWERGASEVAVPGVPDRLSRKH